MVNGIDLKIKEANNEVIQRMLQAQPVLVDISPAGDVIPGLMDKMVLHSGPPVEWQRMSGAQKGSIIGILQFEGWAKNADEAFNLMEQGEIKLEPNHHHQAVGPMAGTITRSLPVFVIENKAFGNYAYSRPSDSRQLFGEFSKEAINNLHLWKDIWAPTLRNAIHHLGGIPINPIISKCVNMGEDLHNRAAISSCLFANQMGSAMVEIGTHKNDLISTFNYISKHELFFLGLAMASSKATVDPAMHIEYSTIVVTMSRNGTEFGIRVSGLGDRWFTADAPTVEGSYLPGYSDKDAGFDMGDSCILETAGLGGFVIGGVQALAQLIGGTSKMAFQIDREMREITVTTNPNIQLSTLDFINPPLGIDIMKVVETGIQPAITTGIAHKDPGFPKIGGGIVRAPIECFNKALIGYQEKYLS